MFACGPESYVPGKVINSFIRGRAIQRINDDIAAAYSASLFAELAHKPAPWHPTLDEVLVTCLSARDLEDLIWVYLQRRMGYLAMPAARRDDTPAYEYVLLHPDDGHEAVVQVKTGLSVVPRDSGSLPTEVVELVFVFSPNGIYGAAPAPNVVKLAYDDIIDFMRSEPNCLPPIVAHWVRMATEGPSLKKVAWDGKTRHAVHDPDCKWLNTVLARDGEPVPLVQTSKVPKTVANCRRCGGG
jgi:hypothetical protein